ncbi:c2 calcium-dependent membrane targeting [Anaeramoeba flamelloides]|uniref:C2 calcium-dependent membrane targeting n=1 Tax=Anaeramoeba flamelloides TaxID=1746091 RepID=A0ABQ8YSG2_9EUKA|nr:c2 calcium-dependent membrane targeting [Anaeramoeba flamelloides]
MSRQENYGSKQVKGNELMGGLKIDPKFFDGKGRADFQVRVHVIEARELKGKGKNGLSDPLVQISIDGQKQHTKVFKNTSSCTFDHLFFYDFKWKPQDFMKHKVLVQVMDSNTVKRNVLIGQYELDAAYVYGESDHEIWHKWLLLTDTDSSEGSQGYLKVSVIVLAPGDQEKTHQSDGIDDEEGDEDSEDLQSMILKPPNIDTQGYHLNVFCYRAEHLPKMDAFGKADPFFEVRFGGNKPIRTSVKKKNLNPVWNEVLRVPVFTPTLSNIIDLKLFDWEKKSKSNDLISSTYFRFTDIQLEEMAPRWINFYGPPKTSVGTMFKKGQTEETVYKGRALVAINAEIEDSPKLGMGPTQSGKLPATDAYVFRLDLFEGTEFNASGMTSAFVELSIGPYELRSKRHRIKKGSVSWWEAVPEKVFTLPKDKSQCPDLFLNVYSKSKVAKRSRLGFIRIPFSECVGFGHKPTWGSLIPDKKSSAYVEGKVPGFIAYRLDIGQKRQADQVKRQKMIEQKLKKYELRMHIYQGRNLPPADKNGLSDPYCRIRIGKYSAKCKTIQETLNPTWFETVTMPVELPDPISYAPNVSVLCYDWDAASSDDLLGRFDIKTVEIGQRFPPSPKWHKLYMDNPEITFGEVLASFQLVPYEERKNFPIPQLVPEYKDCIVEISAVGVRSLLPYKMRKISKPAIEFDLCHSKMKKKEKKKMRHRTQPSNTPIGSSSNHLETFRIPVKLPLNHLFATSVNIRVYDHGKMGNPLVGAGAIPLGTFLPWADVPFVAQNIPPKVDKIPGAIEEMDLTDDEDENKMEKVKIIADEIPTNIEDVNEIIIDHFSFETEHNEMGFVGIRTIPEVRETFLEEFVDSDEEEYVGFKDPKEGRNKTNYELEHELKELPFYEWELTRGKVRGLSAFEKMFQDKRRNPNTVRSVGKFKGKIKVYDTPNMEDLDEPDNLQELFKPTKMVVRVYVLRGMQLVPKDSNGLSDPYIVVSNGKKKENIINDRENYQKETLRPNFYKCFELPCIIPGNSELKVQVFDWDRFSSDDLIGETIIDLENRWFSQEWQDMNPKPVEYRTLWAPTSSNPQGKLEMWIEIMTEEQAAQTPQTVLEAPKPLPYELRVIAWNTKDVVFMDKNMSDIFVTCQMNDGKKQSSDIHWRSKDGTGAFNWRYIFPVELPARVPRIKFQLWDKDILTPNDSIGEANINLKGLFKRAEKRKTSQTIKQQWISLLHPNHEDEERGKIEVSIEILPESEARAKPAGLGRKDPNENPHLEDPVRPFSSFAPWRLDKYFKIGWGKYRKYVYCAICCLLCLVIMIIVIYLKSFV